MTDDELLPCPFCGGGAFLQPQQGDNPKPFAWDVIHHCGNVGFTRMAPRDLKNCSTKEQAVAAWNARADDEAGGGSVPEAMMDRARERAANAVHNAQIAELDALRAKAEKLAEALERTLNFIENTESAMGDTLESGDKARAALADWNGGKG